VQEVEEENEERSEGGLGGVGGWWEEREVRGFGRGRCGGKVHQDQECSTQKLA
jgi:hypothetical protein